MTTPWLLVAGDFTPLGGMDAANYALARYLAARREVHLVTHRAWPDLETSSAVTVHRVWRPGGRHAIGAALLGPEGRRVARSLQGRHAHTVVNGGNCRVADVNWVHYLHAACEPQSPGAWLRRTKAALLHRRDLAAERTALIEARLVLCNSRRTQRDVVDRIGIPESRTRIVYYGCDASRLMPATADERAAAKRRLGCSAGRPLVGFVGALGDRRKAFDTLFAAWAALCAAADWDADLMVVGTGAELPAWQQRAHAAGISERIRFAGFRRDVPEMMAAFDALVHPSRYEAYGLSVHEALCHGIPAMVSASAGVAEHYGAGLRDLLIGNSDDSAELIARLLAWRRHVDDYRDRIAPLSHALRARTWDVMAQEVVDLVEQAA
jgi:glycosyltransferase involved in cell wall biosynthesis